MDSDSFEKKDYFGFEGQAKLYAQARPHYPDMFFEQAYNHISKGKYRTCLDIGTGTGLIAKQLSSKFERVIGLDISESQLL